MKIAHKTLTAVVAVGIGLSGATVPAAAAEPASAGTVAPSAKKIQVGVAPSPNGYVMANVPTQIAVNKKATVYQRVGNKWIQLGKATPTKAVPVTFKSNGIKKLRVKSGKKSKIVKVGVYDRFNAFTGRYDSTPTQYDQLILPSSSDEYGNESVSVPAARGCVLVDAGIKHRKREGDYSFTIASTGANPFNSPPLQSPNAFSVQNVPVAGDIVTTVTADGISYTFGMMITCLNSR